MLSFENPNYTLAGGADSRLDDALNRNGEDSLDGGLAALGECKAGGLVIGVM